MPKFSPGTCLALPPLRAPLLWCLQRGLPEEGRRRPVPSARPVCSMVLFLTLAPVGLADGRVHPAEGVGLLSEVGPHTQI